MLGHLLFPRVAGLLLGHLLLPRVLHEHTLSALLQPLLLCLHLRLGGEVGLLCSVLLLFRHVMHAATVGRDSCHDVAWQVTYHGRACMCGIPFVWIPVLKGGAAMLAAPDNLRCGRGHRALCPGATPLCCNHSLVRRHGPLEAAEAIYNQEAPQLARITSWA